MAKNKPIGFRKQGIGLLLFLVFVIIIRLFIYYLPEPAETVISQDSLSISNTYKQDTVILRSFDPNTADSLTLIGLGLRSWQVKNLLHYRAKGGRFRTADDFHRLYGLTDSAYQTLRPYICIDTLPFYAERRERMLRDSLRRDSIQHRYEARRDSLQSAYLQHRDSLIKAGKLHIKKDTIIELNTTDTADLQYIRGIGGYTARQIINYRNQLGGYYSTRQLLEIKHIDYLNWDSILPHMTVDTTKITRINIQMASVERLRRHPYISFTQAKSAYELRRRLIRLKGIEDLYPSVFTKEEAERLKPYLDFTPLPKPVRR